MSAVHIAGLRKTFRQHLRGGVELDVLRGVDLSISNGECVALTGPSGSGKSSLLRCLYRTYLPTGGSMVLTHDGSDVDLAGASEREVLELRRTAMGMATQFLQVVPRLSARELVAAEGVEAAVADGLLLDLGLNEELLDASPATFSGGERQIVNLALALARQRPLLLLDEVTASLDTARRDLALELLARRKAEGATMLAVFHDVPGTPGLVDRVVRLAEGTVAA
ncbi:MAG: ATP-binding cassette domain-containing protein [Chloroflexi bacterium]|nr:ATP-binding cassette domain-containing protein [Chloroflexota bacterium]